MRIYLDNCCFNRPFDDQTHFRIRIEAEAKLVVFAEDGDVFGGRVEVNEAVGLDLTDGEGTKAVPLEKVVGNKKLVPLDHPWIRTARNVGTCLGD